MQFIFHIGPPKTGTSAIQYWCETHRDELLKHNIYYPAHDVDANGISPGNLQSIYSIGEENNHLTLNTKKTPKTHWRRRRTRGEYRSVVIRVFFLKGLMSLPSMFQVQSLSLIFDLN